MLVTKNFSSKSLVFLIISFYPLVTARYLEINSEICRLFILESEPYFVFSFTSKIAAFSTVSFSLTATRFEI